MKDEYQLPLWQIPNWVCIAYYESRYNTATYDPNGYYGIFQISKYWWCKPPGRGCGICCNDLLTDDISKDVACAQKIYHDMGFEGWVSYKKYCEHENVEDYVEGCY